MAKSLTLAALAGMIDHSLLRADAREADLLQLCREAVDHGFATVAINTAPVSFCARQLAGTCVGVCAAVGFPLGQVSTAVKVYEAEQAIADGASEIAFVINIGQLKSGRRSYVENEIVALAKACGGVTTKVIMENCYLTDAEKQQVVEMAIDAGADFIKTSTGRGTGGATMPDVLLMRSLARSRIRIKAAGGIRTLDRMLAFVDAGADRIGTSHGLAIMASAREVLPE